MNKLIREVIASIGPEKSGMASMKQLALSGARAISLKVLENPRIQRIIFNSIRVKRSEFHRLWSKREIKFLSYIFLKRQMSRAQVLQDLWVCFELNDKRDGFFVEFGATNGLTNSNTWLLETTYDWKGILVEPNPIWHSELTANRRVAIEHRCVSSKSDDIVCFIVTDNSDPELSGIASFCDGDDFAGARTKGKKIELETISLLDLLEKYRAPKEVDYLSIDTEGNEFDILSVFDFDKYKFRLISVEQNRKTEHKIQKLLESKGYIRVFAQFSLWDGWYVSADLKHGAEPEVRSH